MPTTALSPASPTATDAASATRAALARIAPLWPLKHFVAVNPFMGLLDRPFAEACDLLRRTAGAAPPACAAERHKRVAGKRISSGAKNVSSPRAGRSSGAIGVSMRCGQARHEAIGTRISLGPSCASVEPSRYSTSE